MGFGAYVDLVYILAGAIALQYRLKSAPVANAPNINPAAIG